MKQPVQEATGGNGKDVMWPGKMGVRESDGVKARKERGRRLYGALQAVGRTLSFALKETEVIAGVH